MRTCSWRHIEIFHAIMTTKNLTQAAELLQTSQPTVSRELARLEHLIGFKLFDRIKGRLHPTEQGLQFFDEVERSYYGLDRIWSAAKSIRQFHHAQLAITCLPVFAQSLLPKLCHHFSDKYPNVNFTIVPQESPLLEEWLSAQRYDLGITEHLQTPAGTQQQTLLTLNEVCVLPVNHPLCKKSHLSAEDFAQEKFISLSITDSYRKIIDTYFTEKQISRRLFMETHSAAAICAMVREGMGISIVNPLTALDYYDLSNGQGMCLRPLDFSIPFTVSLIRPEHRPSSELTNIFIDHLSQSVDEFSDRLAAAFQQKLRPIR